MGNHLKKLLAVLMTLTMLLGMLPAATLAEMAEDAAAETAAVVSEVKEEATEEPTPEPTEEPTPEPTEEPTPEPTEEPTPEPTEEPAEEPTQSPIEEDGEGDGGEEGDPTVSPTEEPEDDATVSPTEEPEDDATVSPTEEPEAEVTQTPAEDAVEEVTVYLTLSGKDEITVGKSATLSAKTEEGNTVKNANISWTSSDKAIATVKSGVVTAKAPGSVTITGTTKSGRVGVKEIEVLPKATALTLVLDGEELPAKHTRIANYTEEKSLQLSAKLLPAEASQSVSWKSSDSKIAKVSSDGNIEYKKPGTVTITATAKDGSKKAASLTLKIRRFVTDITITGKEGLACGKKTTLKAKVTPSNASIKSVKWESSDTAVASINSEGLVTAKTVTEPTEVIITASAKDGSGIVGTHSLWIHPAAKKVQILKDGEDAGSSLIMDLVGAPEVTLSAKVFEDNAYQGVSWKSSASSIVKVENGVLTARKPGKATITATAKDGTGKKDTITVTVRRFVTDITITGKDALACGKKTTLKAKVAPSNASVKSVKWASSDKTVASINSEGLVTAKTVTEPTEVIITASTKDGSGIVGTHSLWIHPAAKKVQILKDGEDAGSSLIMDLVGAPEVTLTARVFEDNAYQGVSWKSSASSIVKVENGVLTARKPGKATITATAKDGTGKKDTITVTVRRFVTDITITGKDALACGKKTTLKAKVAPSNASIKSVKWASSDKTVASINSEGLVTAKTVTEPTEVILTASAKDGSGIIGSHSLWIHPAAKSVQILKDGEDAGKSAIIDFTNNPTLTLTSAIAPENAYQGVSWKSSNTAVARIEDGVITALKPGTVTITATAKDGTGKKDTLTVYVRRFVTGIEITGSTSVIAPGKTKTLKAVVSPSNATMKSVKWTSSDTTIAKVSSSGVVTAATGLNRIATVTITATAKDGSGVSAQFEVSVGKDSKVYRALLIGNTYPGTSNYLPGPDNDLAGMKKMLARQTKTKYSVSTRENVTAGQIESAIYDTFEYADANDVSLFYYSGHGTSSGSLCGTGNTYVTVDNLRTYLDTVPGTKIVILDSCYSGTHINRSASRSSDSETTIVQNADPSDFNDAVLSAFSSSVYSRANLATGGYVVLTACSKNEESFSVSYDGEEYVGAFTYSLTLGSGWDMLDKSTCTRYSDSLGNQNGKIELYEAYGFAVAMVDEMMYGNQNVQFWGSDGDFVLWRYK